MPYLEALQKYAVFEGRAKRSEFWLFMLGQAIIAAALNALALAVEPGLYAVYFLYFLATFLPSLAVTVRRLHDTGKNGWYILVILIPLIGWIILLVLMVMRSDDDNEFGPRPA